MVHLENRRQWRTFLQCGRGRLRWRKRLCSCAKPARFGEKTRFEFVDFIARNPQAGDLIPGSGGVRKVRWGRQGSGKRGGVRIIYFYHDPAMPLYLLMIYAKARRDDLSPDARRAVEGLVARLKAAHRH